SSCVPFSTLIRSDLVLPDGPIIKHKCVLRHRNHKCRKFLSYFCDFQMSLALAMSMDFAYSLLCLVPDCCNFISLSIGFNHISGNDSTANFWGADSSFVTVNYQKRCKADCFLGVLN